MTADLGIEPRPHGWWEASALTTAPSLHPEASEQDTSEDAYVNEFSNDDDDDSDSEGDVEKRETAPFRLPLCASRVIAATNYTSHCL